MELLDDERKYSIQYRCIAVLNIVKRTSGSTQRLKFHYMHILLHKSQLGYSGGEVSQDGWGLGCIKSNFVL